MFGGIVFHKHNFCFNIVFKLYKEGRVSLANPEFIRKPIAT